LSDITKRDLRKLRRQYKKVVRMYDDIFDVRGVIPMGTPDYLELCRIQNHLRNTLGPYERLLK